MAASDLVVNAVELLRVPGSRRTIERSIALGELDIDDPRVAGDVGIDLVMGSTLDDIEVRGELTVAWSDECRRCLRPLSAELHISVDERYSELDGDRIADPAEPADLDTFPITNRQIDLRSMVRESVLLGIPDAPLCGDDCPGLCPICGADLSAGPCQCQPAARDERWAVLDQLREP